MRGLQAVPGKPSQAPEPPGLETIPDDIYVSVFVELDEEQEMPSDLPKATARRGKLMTLDLRQSQIETVSGLDGIAYVTTGETLSPPNPIRSSAYMPAPAPRSMRSEEISNVGHYWHHRR